MMLAEALDILMFVTVCGFLLLGFPVAFTLAGTALLFALIGLALGVFDMGFVAAIANRIFGQAMWNEVLLAVPLFVFMGVMLERSRVAEELLETMGGLFGTLRGGLGISVTIVGMLLAASTGIVGATVVTMGLLSLPTMLKHGYAKPLACGSICAAGTLGQIIPPSIVLVILGHQLSTAYVDAQRAFGNWSPEPLSVGDLFAGALLPGLVLVGMYILYQTLVAWLKPDTSPAMPNVVPGDTAMLPRVLRALLPPVTLMVAVLGSILAGIATPTEAAAVGAVGATLLAGIRVKELGMAENNVEPRDAHDRLSRTLGGAIGGLLVGMLGGQVLFGAPLAGIAIGVPGGMAAVRMRVLRASMQALETDNKSLPIHTAALCLMIVLVLQALVDLRLQRETVPTGDMIAIAAAIVACIGIAWGLLVSLRRVWATGILTVVNRRTMEISAMVFVILIGAALFSLVFRGLGGEALVHAFLDDMPGGIYGAIAVVMVAMFVLGFFLDFIEITFVVIPMVAPALLANDIVSPVWIGILMAMNLQTSFLTPPFGFALFYLRGVAPKEIETLDIYKGVAPFVVIQLIALAIVAGFPALANWLPYAVFGSNFLME